MPGVGGGRTIRDKKRSLGAVQEKQKKVSRQFEQLGRVWQTNRHRLVKGTYEDVKKKQKE